MKLSTWEVLFFIFVGVLVGVYSGYNGGVNQTRRAAIEADVAHWTIDPKTGDSQFKWKVINDR